MRPNRVDIFVHETSEAVARAGAKRFVAAARDSIARRGRFTVVLAGGNTPRHLYELLASPDFKSQIDWSSVQIFFGDERTVSHEHPDSNFRMADEALLSRVAIPAANVHPIFGDGDPNENALAYERELKAFFADSNEPRFDLVLLGLGKDAHTASLFPGTKALKESQRWVVANWVAALDSYRLTLTPARLNSSAEVCFLVTGSDKAPAVAAVLEGSRDADRFPAQLIQPADGNVVWLMDAKAASELRKVVRAENGTTAV